MKLVAVSRVRNEVDIIEAFVRHHSEHFHKLIILDDGSSDETMQVLGSLQAAGLPLVLLQEQALTYDQSRYMTLLLHMAVDQFGADWVAPLDADEFIEPRHGMTLAEALAAREPQLYAIPWHNFLWSAQSAANPESNPVVRMRMRLPSHADSTKLLVPAGLVDDRTQLAQGNHNLLRDGIVVPTVPLDTVHLCHFPIRDPIQYAGKIAVGYLKYAAMDDWDGHLGFQYIEPYRSLLAGSVQALEQRMHTDSCAYALSIEARESELPEARDGPLAYRGGPITSNPSRQALLPNILRYAEALSKELASSSRQQKAAVAELALSRGEYAAAVQGAQQLAGRNAALEEQLLKFELELLAAREERLSAKAELDLSRREHAAALQNAQQLSEQKAALEKRLSDLELELLAAREDRLSAKLHKLLDRVRDRLDNAGPVPRAIAISVFRLLRVK